MTETNDYELALLNPLQTEHYKKIRSQMDADQSKLPGILSALLNLTIPLLGSTLSFSKAIYYNKVSNNKINTLSSSINTLINTINSSPPPNTDLEDKNKNYRDLVKLIRAKEKLQRGRRNSSQNLTQYGMDFSVTLAMTTGFALWIALDSKMGPLQTLSSSHSFLIDFLYKHSGGSPINSAASEHALTFLVITGFILGARVVADVLYNTTSNPQLKETAITTKGLYGLSHGMIGEATHDILRSYSAMASKNIDAKATMENNDRCGIEDDDKPIPEANEQPKEAKKTSLGTSAPIKKLPGTLNNNSNIASETSKSTSSGSRNSRTTEEYDFSDDDRDYLRNGS